MRRPAAAACIGLSLASLYACGVLDHDLWTPDEPRVASVGRQVAEGAWIVPTLNGRPFLEEPPLHAWCVAAVYRALGFEPARLARLVSVAFGAAGILAAYALCARLRGPRAGLLSALFLAVAAESFATAHRVVVDGALAAFTTASAYAFLRAVPARGGPRAAWFAAGCALASLAFLAKGPVGLAVPGLAFAAACAAWRTSPLGLHLLLAPVLFAAVAGPWLALLGRETGLDGLRTLLADNTLGRVLPAAPGSRSHLRPIWFYAAYLPVHLLPATPFAALGALDRWLRRRSLEPSERRAYDFALLWLALGVAVLSAASTKRAVYLVPFFPAAAILAGVWLDGAIARPAPLPARRAAGLVLAGTPALLGLAVPVLSVLAGGGAPSLAWAVLAAGSGLALGAWAALAAGRGALETAAVLFACGIAAAAVPASIALVPAIDRQKSLGPLAREVARLVPDERPICALEPDETTEGMVPLYTGRPLVAIESVGGLEERLGREGELYLLTVEKRGRRPTQLERVEHLQPEVLLEDVREGTRTFRLLRLGGR